MIVVQEGRMNPRGVKRGFQPVVAAPVVADADHRQVRLRVQQGAYEIVEQGKFFFGRNPAVGEEIRDGLGRGQVGTVQESGFAHVHKRGVLAVPEGLQGAQVGREGVFCVFVFLGAGAVPVQVGEGLAQYLRGVRQAVRLRMERNGIMLVSGTFRAASIDIFDTRKGQVPYPHLFADAARENGPEQGRIHARHQGLHGIHVLFRRPRELIHGRYEGGPRRDVQEGEHGGIGRFPLVFGSLRRGRPGRYQHGEQGQFLQHGIRVDIAAHHHRLLVGVHVGNVEYQHQRAVHRTGVAHRNPLEPVRGGIGRDGDKSVAGIPDSLIGQKTIGGALLEIGDAAERYAGGFPVGSPLLDEGDIGRSLVGPVGDQVVGYPVWKHPDGNLGRGRQERQFLGWHHY